MPYASKVALSLLSVCFGTASAVRAEGPSFTPQTGTAAYYSHVFEGRKTADHGTFHSGHMTAASSTIPLRTKVRVTNVKNGKSVVVRVTDKYSDKGRIIDVSKSAARKLGFVHAGTAEVKVEPV